MLEKEELKKLDFVDALRGIAILGVICVHVYIESPYHGFGEWLILKGNRGVQLFYLLSAFTLFYSMMERKEEKNPLGNYFIRRFFRIAPLFYISIIYYLWEDGLGPRFWLGDAPGISTSNIIATFTFTNGFNPYWINSIVPGGWSIAVEMGFYLLLPILYRFIKSIRAALIWLFASYILLKIFYYILLHNLLIKDPYLWGEFGFLSLPSQLPVFITGIVFFEIWRRQGRISSKMKILSFPISVLIIVAAYFLHGSVIPEHVVFGVAFLFLAFGLSQYPVFFLVNPVTKYFGKISFSLYLAHPAVIFMFQKLSFLSPGSFFVQFPLVLIVSTAIASATYFFIEKPGINIGKKLVKMREGNNSLTQA